MDRLTKAQRRKTMQAVKSTGSKIERRLASALWNKGYHYRKNNKTVLGKPDFTFKQLKIAIFVDSEFWHGKNWSLWRNKFKSNKPYWHKKIERNIKRDKFVTKQLRKEGWIVLRFWGANIEQNLENCMIKIEKAFSERESIQNR